MHFNDVYEIESGKKEPVGGAARFAAKLKEVTTAGDREPGLLTTCTLGEEAQWTCLHVRSLPVLYLCANHLQYNLCRT